ncbi:MAG TPA: site-specific integrase [Candidatus Cybelea sp.]|jgi:integrase|nr:site-specific integrase [Candidatus Cybelea sp.]
MTSNILPQVLPAGASADNREYSALCEVDGVVDRAREFVEASQSTATRRAYASDWRDFEGYCSKRGYAWLPATPQTLTVYLTDLADRAKFATIKRRVAAISQTHKERGLESPTTHEIVRRVVRGIGRTIGAAQVKKSAVTLDHLRAMLLEIRGDDLKAKRDRAILLLCFAAALRRSELAALTIEDLTFCREGLRIVIRRSKTDQDGAGAFARCVSGSTPPASPPAPSFGRSRFRSSSQHARSTARTSRIWFKSWPATRA